MKRDRDNEEKTQDFGWQKEKRKQRFKNKRRDKKRFNNNLGKLFDDRYDDNDDEIWNNDDEN